MTKKRAFRDLFAKTREAIAIARKIKNPAQRSFSLKIIKAKAFAEHDILTWYYIIRDIKGRRQRNDKRISR